jgi:hypothetical protein
MKTELPDVAAMRPFVPAKDFRASERFYTELGFRPEPLGDGLVAMHMGAFSFLLQAFYVRDLAENFMMSVVVPDLDAWWAHIDGLKLTDRYDIMPPAAPAIQPWGLMVAYVWDPVGVLWHFVQQPQAA